MMLVMITIAMMMCGNKNVEVIKEGCLTFFKSVQIHVKLEQKSDVKLVYKIANCMVQVNDLFKLLKWVQYSKIHHKIHSSSNKQPQTIIFQSESIVNSQPPSTIAHRWMAQQVEEAIVRQAKL